ncbi:hypothetical protein HOLleu_02835 [Holothuria leucospilota]|uniref:Uncharacterized protein n=1 Tax=Holothuria leucospilota TaxID=206669 RepID=A0A9Q1CQ48_HOLLE|nr:hypothetical protein HOLleu_02835 [Holothuria leucospilota]
MDALETYFIASGADEKSDLVKMAKLLRIGDERMIYNAFQWENDEDVNKGKMKAEFNKKEDAKVIVKETESTELVNSLVAPVKPSGDLGVCTDPRDLEKALQESITR